MVEDMTGLQNKDKECDTEAVLSWSESHSRVSGCDYVFYYMWNANIEKYNKEVLDNITKVSIVSSVFPVSLHANKCDCL